MNKSKLALVLAAVAVALLLLTVWMALYYATIPQTSVKSADEVLSSIEGRGIRVAGFVCARLPGPDPVAENLGATVFSIADFSDFLNYRDAVMDGRLNETWWTVRPLDVLVRSTNEDIRSKIALGANLSVLGTVSSLELGPNSNVTGLSLEVSGADNVLIGTSASQFDILTAPVAQKIFYFHMPSAWISYVAFFTTLLASALYLKTRDQKYDRWAHSAAELGVLFATIAISTGPVWAKEEWGVYWRWNDSKLVTTFILWLVYIGYLMLRASVVDQGTKARVSAVYGIIGFITVPMSLLSARVAPLLRSSHPVVIAIKGGGLSPEAGMTIGVALLAFTALYITMLIKRVEIAEADEELEELKRNVGEEES
ncbi:MAG: cytochrome c biogenesis protein [Candidatus Thermoplasmatota archaeon]|nr:cytochrome c biogenesis protein [Candidatus Thermoplasmatota archaeon]MBU1914355.1 cytochrome c biogenesis protein [Candidatus Thermoplasmatota archaeon]